MVWFSLQILSETFLIVRRTKRDMIKIYELLHVKCPLSLSDFNETWISSRDLGKTFKYQILWKYFQWETSCSMRTSGRKDMTKLIVAFHTFAKAAKNKWYILHGDLLLMLHNFLSFWTSNHLIKSAIWKSWHSTIATTDYLWPETVSFRSLTDPTSDSFVRSQFRQRILRLLNLFDR